MIMKTTPGRSGHLRQMSLIMDTMTGVEALQHSIRTKYIRTWVARRYVDTTKHKTMTSYYENKGEPSRSLQNTINIEFHINGRQLQGLPSWR